MSKKLSKKDYLAKQSIKAQIKEDALQDKTGACTYSRHNRTPRQLSIIEELHRAFHFAEHREVYK
jgi:hypothetical protein